MNFQALSCSYSKLALICLVWRWKVQAGRTPYKIEVEPGAFVVLYESEAALTVVAWSIELARSRAVPIAVPCAIPQK